MSLQSQMVTPTASSSERGGGGRGGGRGCGVREPVPATSASSLDWGLVGARPGWCAHSMRKFASVARCCTHTLSQRTSSCVRSSVYSDYTHATRSDCVLRVHHDITSPPSRIPRAGPASGRRAGCGVQGPGSGAYIYMGARDRAGIIRARCAGVWRSCLPRAVSEALQRERR